MDRMALGALISITYRSHFVRINIWMKELGLSEGQFFVLMVLSDEQGLTQNILAKRLLIDKESISWMVKVLEDKGLVKRITDKNNRRAVCLHLTETGEQLVPEVVKIDREWEEVVFSGFTEDEKIGFDGSETASRKPYLETAETFEGPDLKLTDAYELCDHSRFCQRAGGIRDLIQKSDDPEARQTAIEEAMVCPSGRLVLWDKKTGKPFEKEFEPSIVLVHDKQKGCEGSLWVRGGIPIESADGNMYESRNRVTLCRCGKSENKPYCDGSHWMNSQQKLEFRKKWGLE